MSSTIDGVELVRGPRVIFFRCPRGCGVVEWRERGEDGAPCARLFPLKDAEEALVACVAGRGVAFPATRFKPAPEVACQHCGARRGEGQEHGVYTVEAVGGAGEKWRAGRG